MDNSILKKALGLEGAVVLGLEERAGGDVVVDVRPRAASARCPACGRRCGAYDELPARLWRALDLGLSRCYVRYAPTRVECPVHGVLAESVPWARCAASRMTSAFEDQVAWCATQMSRRAAAELMRVSWRTVGSACGRVCDELLASEGGSLLRGLRRIGVDETSRRKGHCYVTVVVDHDRGKVVWCHDGYGKEVLAAFLDELDAANGGEGCASLEVVTADGARWIADVVAERCPGAERVMDPFHVVQWATDALDGLRRDAWNEVRRGLRGRGEVAARPGGPRAGEGRTAAERAAAEAAEAVKGSRYALLKNPEDLTEGQSATLAGISSAGGALWRGYLLKEGLRGVFRAGSADEAEALLGRWLSWACRCRIPSFVKLSRRVRARRDAIVRAVALGISNARVEAMNNKVKLTVRMAYGFRNVANMLALIMLRCSPLTPSLPGRT